MAHRTRHRQDTKLRPATRLQYRVVLHNDCCPHSQQALPARPVGLSGAVVLTAGAVSPFFPRPAPSSFTATGAGSFSPSPSVCPSISRGAHSDVTSVQYAVERCAGFVPTRRFFAQFLTGASSPLPLCGGGGGTGGDFSPDFVNFVRWCKGMMIISVKYNWRAMLD